MLKLVDKGLIGTGYGHRLKGSPHKLLFNFKRKLSNFIEEKLEDATLTQKESCSAC